MSTNYDKQVKLWQACSKALEDPINRSECNKFVHAVARALHIPMDQANNANAIYEEIKRPPWTPLGVGFSAGDLAAKRAVEGHFVVGAWFNSKTDEKGNQENGHVLIVTGHEYILRGNNKPNALTNAAQGSHNHPERAFLHQTIRSGFNSTALRDVFYAYRPIP